jgi:hypothetical protein
VDPATQHINSPGNCGNVVWVPPTSQPAVEASTQPAEREALRAKDAQLAAEHQVDTLPRVSSYVTNSGLVSQTATTSVNVNFDKAFHDHRWDTIWIRMISFQC